MKKHKLLIIIEWILATFSVAIDDYFGSRLMDELAYKIFCSNIGYDNWYYSSMDSVLLLSLAVGSIAILLNKINWFSLYAFSFIGLIIMTAFGGTVVASGPGESIYALALVAGGISLKMGYDLYGSDISQKVD